MGTYQTSLFAQGEPVIATDAVVGRVDLDEESWMELSRGWLRGADELLADLADRLEWATARRPMFGRLVEEPRLGASCSLDDSPPAAIGEMVRWVDARYHEGIDSVWCNYYRDGRDSVAWHSDRVGRTRVNPIVAIVSLGGPRRFSLRPRRGGPSQAVVLGSGDLLVMGGACQHRWEHAVLKTAAAAPCISVTMRRREGRDAPENDWWRQRSAGSAAVV